MAKFLISRGHECRVLLHQGKKYGINYTYIHEGVEVFPAERQLDTHIHWANLVITHLEYTKWTLHICRVLKKKVVFVAHNTSKY